mmetsp:Transcript_18624/g.35542  ORF Transcript_18624/g.35542 Transcript_18624/m.35542 type:complete len:183 (-) Transcript_18624:17-565(-)
MKMFNSNKSPSSHDDDELIVNFPDAGRRRTIDREIDALPSAPKKIRVHFSETSTMATFEKSSDEENQRKWSSSTDRKRFRHDQIADVLRMRAVFESTPYDKIPHNELCRCVGIESLMSTKLLERTLEHRANHLNVILFEQKCQRDMGVCDPDRLASIAERHSRKVSLRAHKIANGYMNLMLN